MKHDIPLSLDYQTSPSIYSDNLEYDVGVLVAFGLLDVQIISGGEYVDRIYRVTEKGEEMLESVLQDKDAERMYNQLKLDVRELEDLPISELVAQARMFIHHAVPRI